MTTPAAFGSTVQFCTERAGGRCVPGWLIQDMDLPTLLLQALPPFVALNSSMLNAQLHLPSVSVSMEVMFLLFHVKSCCWLHSVHRLRLWSFLGQLTACWAIATFTCHSDLCTPHQNSSEIWTLHAASSVHRAWELYRPRGRKKWVTVHGGNENGGLLKLKTWYLHLHHIHPCPCPTFQCGSLLTWAHTQTPQVSQVVWHLLTPRHASGVQWWQ